MANFFTRALDVITPWNRGGEVQRRQDRKKKQEEEQAVRQSAPRQAPQVRRPVNNFSQDPLQDNRIGSKVGAVSVPRGPELQAYEAMGIEDMPKPKPVKPSGPSPLDSVSSFADTAADKLGGGIGRAGLRTAAIAQSNPIIDNPVTRAIPGVNRLVDMRRKERLLLEDTAKEWDKRAEASAKRQKDQAAAAAGKSVGSAQKGMVDIASLVIPGTAADRGLEGVNLVKNGGRIGEAANFIARQLPGSFLGTGTDYLQDKGRGKDQNLAKNAAVGTGLDVLLPTIFKGLSKLLNIVNPGSLVDTATKELDNTGITTSIEQSLRDAEPRSIRVQKNIPIDEVTDGSFDVPVSVNTPQPPQGPLIREIGGDAAAPVRMPSPEELTQRRVVENFANQAPVRPDTNIQGVTPRAPERPFSLDDNTIATGQDKIVSDYADMLRSMGEGNGVDVVNGTRRSNNVRFGDTKGKRMTKAMWKDEAARQLREGKADPTIQKAFKDAEDPEIQSLLAKGEQPTAEPGRPITVKQAKGISVRDDTVVPTKLPETPGKVRATSSTEPTKARTEAVAAQTPPSLPKETQDVLDNPKLYNKRQVASARNQRKLARQMAKTQEDTAEAMSRIEKVSTTKASTQSDQFAPTGEFGTGKKGGAYEKANRTAEADLGRKEMAYKDVESLAEEVTRSNKIDVGNQRRISAAKENIVKADPENGRNSEVYKILDQAEKADRTKAAQLMALIPRTIRKSATSDALTARWERKITNIIDSSKLSDDQWKAVQSANDEFTTARNKAEALNEQFKKTGSEADFKAWEKAYNAARDADTSAKMTEVKTAQEALKGEKGSSANKIIDDLKKEAEVNTMDFTTANMLSGTGTGFRNTFGTELMGIENRVGANLRAKVTKGIFKENVGGFDRKAASYGRKFGFDKWKGDAVRRAENGGKNPLEWAKNWSTTINSAGESSLQSQVYSRLGKYYKNQFASNGLTGKQLDMRMRHAMLTDPDNMADIYLDSAMKSSGLTGMFEKGQTIEKAVTDYIGRNTDSKFLQGASKLAMRIAVGFPTATTNFLAQSGKRLTVGLPSFIETGMKAAKGDKAGAAMAFERGLKEAGSGAAMLGLGAALGKAGIISGPYPDDKDERERWTRDGISENSIKIGGAWYPIPQSAGMLGLPIMVGAAVGAEGDTNDSLKRLLDPKSLAKLLPTDQIQGTLNMLSGDESPQALKNTLASAVRAGTPVGALFNQIAKSFDPTKNDTTTKGLWGNVFDQVISGIPGVNNMANIPDKTDAEGNPIKNPNALQLALGASSAVQGGGEARSQQIDEGINSEVAKIDKYGLLNDKNMDGVLEGTALEAFNKAKSGKQLDESDTKALKEGLVKGVSSEGTDTAYLERGQYDTNLAVLKMKRDLMNGDPTVKPSSLKDIDTAIKRGEIYKQDKMPYELISDYKRIGVEDWRKMGDPEKDEYDPEMYQKLWDIDQRMTKSGVSYGKELDKAKYSAKKSGGKGGGRGGRGGRGGKISTEFGTLKDGSFAPRVKEYAGIDAKSGSVPVIGVKRPNIVHKISSSG